MTSLVLKSIAEEAAACRKAWAAAPDAKYGAHIHHESCCEALTEPIENRIAYILSKKPERERALRLRLMRPITATAWKAYNKATATAWKAYTKATATVWKAYNKATATARKAYDEYTETAQKAYDEAAETAQKAYDEAAETAHRLVCSVEGCPFDGNTIFPEHEWNR